MYRKEIEEYIDSHKNQMIEDICTLCRINSEKMPYTEGKPFGEGPFEVLQTALTMMENYGFSVRNYDNYVGTADLNDKEAQLDILAHLDIVPAGEGWTVTEPFEPVIKDGKLYGRGSADDKGPAVAALYAMRAVKELGIPVKKNVRLILGTDEECGSSDIAVYYKQEKEAPMTFSPDAEFPVINVEKGRLPGHFVASFEKSDAMPKLVKIDAGLKSNVVPGKAKAVVAGVEDAVLNETAAAVTKETEVTFTFTGCEEGVLITAEGEGAHASTPEEGKNALTALLMLITKLPLASCPQMDAVKSLVKLFPHGDTRGKALGVAMSDEVSGELTIAFDLLHVDAESLDGTFDCRAPICANDENALKVAKAHMAEEGIELLAEHMRAPHYVDGDSHFVRTLLKAYEEYTGLKGSCQYTGGGTYVHSLKNGVAFGCSMPGTDNRMHGADEFAVVKELVDSAKIFAQVIVDLCC